jgi:hypothetical protein
MKHALPLKIGIGFSLLDIENVSSIIWRSFVSFFGFCFIPDECGGHSAEVANKKSTFPPLSFESNKRFHVNHPALAGRDREKKEDSSPLFFCLLGFVSLAGRRAIGRRSFFYFGVCGGVGVFSSSQLSVQRAAPCGHEGHAAIRRIRLVAR